MAGTFLNISRLEARASPASIKGRLWFWALIIVLFVQSSTSIYCGEDDCYALLGVGQDANASDIKRSYYKLSLKHHPDKNPDPESKKLFVKITTAYEILKDNETQAQYDYAIEHPSEDPRAVLVGLLVVLSAFQYLNNVARYNEENDFTPFGGDLIGELKNALLKQRTNRASGSRLEKNAV